MISTFFFLHIDDGVHLLELLKIMDFDAGGQKDGTDLRWPSQQQITVTSGSCTKVGAKLKFMIHFCFTVVLPTCTIQNVLFHFTESSVHNNNCGFKRKHMRVSKLSTWNKDQHIAKAR